MKTVGAILLLLFVTVNCSAQILGCTDPAALNYFASATNNDGSCIYNTIQVAPDTSIILNDTLDETSGLIMWNGMLWTHVDDTDTRLFGLDSTTGNVQVRDSMLNISNIDMEDIAQDSVYIYVGDFGNNANGNRTNLRIYRFRKDSLQTGRAAADTISFAYADQTDFNPQGAYNTDFDCEAFIVTDDSIYLFTKQWLTFGSAIYALPKDTGFHFAQRRAFYDVQGLVTGATYLPEDSLVVLVGYSPLIQPWVMLLYDYYGSSFFSGNKRKINIAIGTSQTEAITSTDGARFYVTNERRTIASTVIPQQLHILDLRLYTDPFLHTSLDQTENSLPQCSVSPVPAEVQLTVHAPAGLHFIIVNALGQVATEFNTSNTTTIIEVATWSAGMYSIVCTDKKIAPVRFVKL